MNKVSRDIVAVFIVGFVILFLLTNAPDTPPEPTAPSASNCSMVKEAMGRVTSASPQLLQNPRPGVMMLPPSFWGSLSEDERLNLLTMLAIQKGCVEGQREAYVSVELRSVFDNRLIGSGPAWNFDEAN